MVNNSFWKHKVFKLFKQSKEKLPECVVIAKVDCYLTFDGEYKLYSVDIDLSKNSKNNAIEKVYCEIYSDLIKQNEGNTPKKKKELPENNIGRKILEKIGWTSGNGLGKNENGITEPITASFKNDKLGLGKKI